MVNIEKVEKVTEKVLAEAYESLHLYRRYSDAEYGRVRIEIHKGGCYFNSNKRYSFRILMNDAGMEAANKPCLEEVHINF